MRDVLICAWENAAPCKVSQDACGSAGKGRALHGLSFRALFIIQSDAVATECFGT